MDKLNNDCFQDIVQKDIVKKRDYYKNKSSDEWNNEWWAWCYKKFSNADDLILDYLRNEEKFISEIRNDLENLKDVLEKLNKKLIEK